jgi:hypothetical protein
MKNDPQHNEQSAMDKDSMPPFRSTQAQIPKEPPVDARLQRWIDFCEQAAKEAVEEIQYEAQFIKNAEEIRKAKAEKRMMAKLKKLEIEQKAVLLAEAQKQIESQDQAPYDNTPRSPSTINALFYEAKAREALRALEREQKEELLRQVMEKRAKEAGDDWPGMQEMSQDPRYDHIPKYYTGEKEIIAKAFSGLPTAMSKGIR